MEADSTAGRDDAVASAGQASVVAICLVLGFFVLPASGAALDFLLGPVRAQDASWMALLVCATAFLSGGAITGNAIIGRRGRFPFSMAFAVFPLAAVVVIGQSISFHDNYRWRQYERAFDFALFNVAYPLTFAAMGWVSTMILTGRQRTAWSAAAACARNGVVGGVIFSVATSFLPLHGRNLAISFAASLAVPAFQRPPPIGHPYASALGHH